MAARKQQQRELDLTKVAKLYLQGINQSEIAQQLGVNQSTISRDLKTLRNRWLASSIRDFDDARAEELAKIDEQERKYHAQVAKLDVIAGVLYKAGELEKAARVIGTLHRFMNSVDDCIKQRCALLGLDAPQRTKSDISITDHDDLLRKLLPELTTGDAGTTAG